MSTAGRSQQQNTVNQANTNTGIARGLENQGQGIASSEINTSGGLSPLLAKQSANEQGQIGKAYQSAVMGAQRGLAQRGMGVAPSGLQASLQNSQINNAGQAKTGEIGQAFGEQNALNQTALNPAISALNAGTGAINASTGANTALSNMPTFAGQVFSGLQGLGNTAGNVMNGYGSMQKPPQ